MPPPARRRRAAAGVLAALAVLVAGACQPVDEEVAGGDPDGLADRDEATPLPGAPVTASRMPAALEDLLTEHAGTAAQWQEGARPVELVAELDEGGWRGATITYLAPEADRFLLVLAGPEGTTQQRPTLETLGLLPIGAAGLDDVPPLPAGAQAPEELVGAAAAALAACDAGDDVEVVVYATGAPAAWDGSSWTEPPTWTATLAAEGGGAVVDPVTAEPVGRGCLASG